MVLTGRRAVVMTRGETPFIHRVVKYLSVDMETNCWNFTGFRDRSGYGIVSPHRGSGVKAHRVVYEAARGVIPDGHVLHHECENPACVNPWHLTAMTREDHGRLHHTKFDRTHCKNGHEWNEENVTFGIYQSGKYAGRPYANCRICQKEKRAAAKKARGPLPRRPRKSHCKNGHEQSGENIGWSRNGNRYCRVCNRERMRIKYRATNQTPH